jgi:hypothetical protein
MRDRGRLVHPAERFDFMTRYVLWFSLFVLSVQVGCAEKSPIIMWHPVSQKRVHCADQACATQYEAAGYVQLTEEQKAKLGIK